MSTNAERQPRVFLIEIDDATRHILKENLHRYGYRVVSSTGVEDALDRVNGGHFDADAILIDLDGSPYEVLDSARRIREAAKLTRETPIVVLSDEYPEELLGQNIAVNNTEYITYLEEPYQLKNLLHRLLTRQTEHVGS